MSIFGAKVAVVYVMMGLVVAVIGGTLIEKLHMERYVEDYIKNASSVDIDSPMLTQKERLEELGMDTAIDHVTDFTQIAAYGVMSTPALVVDGKVVSYGKVLSKDEAKTAIQRTKG